MSALPMPGSRGPRRPLTASAEAAAGLLETARRLSTLVEYHRQLMLSAAAARQETLAQLYDAGLSVRQLAAALQLSPTVVADAIRAGRQTR